MHTFEWEDDRSAKEINDIFCPDDDQRVYIHYNGDYSGDAILNIPAQVWMQMIQSTAELSAKQPYGRVEFKLPARMLADFSRSATVEEALSVIQNMI